MTLHKPKRITFTGIDDRTKHNDLMHISDHFPVEFGILISPSNRDARFPSKQAIEMFEMCAPDPYCLHLSLHCCGGFSGLMQDSGYSDTMPIDDLDNYRRIQLNGNVKSIDNLPETADEFFPHEFIVQQTVRFETLSKVKQLFDASGGNGRFPKHFPKHPGKGIYVGYAGGINLLTIRNFLKKVTKVTNPEDEFWIDIETGVRTDGWFDAELAWDICEKVYGRL